VLGDSQLDPNDLDAAIVAVPSSVSSSLITALRDADVLVIDHSDSDDAQPQLVWPSMNVDVLADHRGHLRIPGAITATLSPMLVELAKTHTLSEVDVVALHSAQSYGRVGAEALSSQTIGLLNKGLAEEGPFGEVLAFNMLAPGTANKGPQTEAHVVSQLQSLCNLKGTSIHVRSMVAPVFAGLSLNLRLKFPSGAAPSPEEVEESLRQLNDVELHTDVSSPMALRDCMEDAASRVGLIKRLDDQTITLVVNADPVYRAAWASTLILDYVVRHDLW
jgi:aspartate-semialdehyde dehydrogenase